MAMVDSTASIAAAMALCVAWPATALATNWQPYMPADKLITEIDADSVHVVKGIVEYQVRVRLASGPDDRFGHPLDAAADCAGRRQATRIAGALLFFPVQEGTWVARQIDAACRLAGVATTPGPEPRLQAISDGASINLATLKVRDGLVFFDFGHVVNQVVSMWNTEVVECSTRRHSPVAGSHYTLQQMVEFGPQARRAEDACRLAHLPMPPGPTLAPVAFNVAIPPEQAGDDNMRYDIVRSGIEVRDGLVHFRYATRLLSDGSLAEEEQTVRAVVDCAGLQRADDDGGRFELQPVAPGTRGALQVGRVCKMAAQQLAASSPPAPAASDPAANALAAKGCRYARIGSMPISWEGPRLRVHGSINGTVVPMLVDTGASNVTIPRRIVDSLSLPVVESIKGQSYGGGGVARLSMARTSTMKIGDVGNVEQLMLVDLDSTNRDVLVGDDFLFQHDLAINDREMAFFTPLDCGDESLAYWDPKSPFARLDAMDASNPMPIVHVAINGVDLRALVDTGATLSILDVAASRKLGVDPQARGATPLNATAIGTHRLTIWPPQPFDSLEIGGEVVHHPRLAVADLFGHAREELSFSWWTLRNAPDMVLGADFLRSHRLLFAKSQHRMYLSYTGGNVFDAPTVSDVPPKAASAAAP